MKEISTSLEGVRLFELPVFRDQRGYFLETYQREKLAALGLRESFVQDNHSRSAPGVLRGLHFQTDPPQGKLVSVIRGAIFDVVVDLRKGSRTFGQWYGVELSSSQPRILWVPYGFAHGFCVLGNEEADVLYKVTGIYNPKTEGGLRWDDPDVGVKWPVQEPNLSPRDAVLPTLRALNPL